MARVGEDTPGFFSPGGAGLFSFFGNEPTGYEALLHRRKIAEALAAQKKGMPKNVGEGLTYLGESIGEAGLNWRLRQAEAEQAKQEAGISGGVPRTGGYQTDTSAPAVLTVVNPPVVTTQPVSQTIDFGTAASFSVVVRSSSTEKKACVVMKNIGNVLSSYIAGRKA